MSDPMEKANKFMGDGVFTEEGDLFDGVEDDGGFEDGSIESVFHVWARKKGKLNVIKVQK